MQLPPGPRLLLALASQCVVLSILTYLVLSLVSQKLSILLPSSILVFFSLLANPFAFVCQVQLRPFVYRYNAKKNKASAAPLVTGTALHVGQKAVASLTSGYPGDVFHAWMLQHGWIYRLPDPTKRQVCRERTTSGVVQDIPWLTSDGKVIPSSQGDDLHRRRYVGEYEGARSRLFQRRRSWSLADR